VRHHRIAVIPGDGIGTEVMPEGVRVIDAAARRFGFSLTFDHFDWSCERMVARGAWMPSDWKDRIGGHDAVFFGATGMPSLVPDHVSLWSSLIAIRQGFDQYANVRPVRLMPGIRSPLVGVSVGDIDYHVIRENTEGEYSSVGGRMFADTEREFVVQQSCFTRTGVDRILRFAFELAMSRTRRVVTSATKSNGLAISMPYWDERFAVMAREFPDVHSGQYHVDALTIQMVLNPQRFDVIVASNLFGDILSDLGPATTGTIGIAPSANINPERRFPSLFEPVHGSAPDIAGRKIANPIGQIWSGAMMLEHLGELEAANAVIAAIERTLAHGGDAPRTPDLGGHASTEDLGKAIATAL
jgi:tartrate dehydrogenase/decarboxylase/D-malate dehydrogenase